MTPLNERLDKGASTKPLAPVIAILKGRRSHLWIGRTCPWTGFQPATRMRRTYLRQRC